jgi:hypothetical protein
MARRIGDRETLTYALLALWAAGSAARWASREHGGCPPCRTGTRASWAQIRTIGARARLCGKAPGSAPPDERGCALTKCLRDPPPPLDSAIAEICGRHASAIRGLSLPGGEQCLSEGIA